MCFYLTVGFTSECVDRSFEVLPPRTSRTSNDV